MYPVHKYMIYYTHKEFNEVINLYNGTLNDDM